MPTTELSCRDSFKFQKRTDALFGEQQRGDVGSHVIGLETPKCLVCSVRVGPGGKSRACRGG